MGIGSINSYANGYSSYPLRDIPQVDAAEVEKQDLRRKEQEESAGIAESSYQQPLVEDNRSRNVDLENISLTFHQSGEGSTIGKDSDILTLDMQKAISDMKKDSILEDYQYFVGSTQEMKAVIAGMDGIVIQKS